MEFSDHRKYQDIKQEAERLYYKLKLVECKQKNLWTYERCIQIAPLTLEINQLKKEQQAIILAHSYVSPEIIHGVADFSGDSYSLSLEARKTKARKIVFAGVKFMAETAKIICPEAEVLIPDQNSGCSLADSLSVSNLLQLKAKYPNTPVLCYINSNAEVKAESDICVTSSNVFDIVASLPDKRLIFVPDRIMAQNIRNKMQEWGIEKEVICSEGTCYVHEKFDPASIDQARLKDSSLKILSHPECDESVLDKSDFVGSTSAMLNYVREQETKSFMLLTECGLINRLEMDGKGKRFISACEICDYMKMNSLEKVRNLFCRPFAHQKIELDANLRAKALKSIERMFELAP